MGRWLESGLVAVIALACANFAAVLVRGPHPVHEPESAPAPERMPGSGSGAAKGAKEITMDGSSGDGVRALERDEVLALPGGRQGSSVRVEAGTIIVTREGDPEDHVLLAGSELQVPGRGRALAWALEPSRIEVRRGAAALAGEAAGAPPARALVAR